MLTTWQTVNGKTYFFDEKKGYMHTGWVTTAAGNKYYFWNDGVIRSGFHKVNNVYYCFNEKGKMYKNCFRKSGNSTYYLQANGTMAKGRLKVKGSWYSFTEIPVSWSEADGIKKQTVLIIMQLQMVNLSKASINRIPIIGISGNQIVNWLRDGRRSTDTSIILRKLMESVTMILS